MSAKKEEWNVSKTRKMYETDNEKFPSCQSGAVKEKNGIRFTVSVPEGEKATLVLYDKKEKNVICELDFPQEACAGNLHSMTVAGISWRTCLYNYKIGEKIICDPYAKLLTEVTEGEEKNVYGELSFESFDWGEDRHPCIPYSDAVMYHLHVRNFTRQPASGVRHRGTFLGLQEKAGYLKELGVNQIKLMPVYDYTAHMPEKEGMGVYLMEKNNRNDCWGYSRGNYYALNRKYAASSNPVKEFKNMVRAFHENNMEVILDMYFPMDVPVRFILDCLAFWISEYHVDGFHIMGRDDAPAWLRGDPVLASCKILVPFLSQAKDPEMKNFAACNDGFMIEARKLLKGDEGVLESFAGRSRNNPAGSGIINYIVNHDGFTLKDLVSYDTKHNEENGEDNRDGADFNFSWNCGAEGPSQKRTVNALRRKQMKNAFLMILLAQGTPMLMSGDEFGNSQNGNNNPYCLDNATSWVDWSAYRKNKKMAEFVQKAIAFRKEHRILHMDSEVKMTDYKALGYPDLSCHSNRAWYSGFEYGSRQIGMMYCGKYAGEDEYIYIAYNLNPLKQELAIPKLPLKYVWHKIIDTSEEESFLPDGGRKMEEELKSCIFPARSITVLIGKKVS